MVHVRSDRAEVWCRSGPGSISMSSPVAELHLSDKVHLSGIRPIDLVSVDLVVSLSRNSTPHTTLHHLGGRNREVCEPCLAVSSAGIHSAPIIYLVLIFNFVYLLLFFFVLFFLYM